MFAKFPMYPSVKGVQVEGFGLGGGGRLKGVCRLSRPSLGSQDGWWVVGGVHYCGNIRLHHVAAASNNVYLSIHSILDYGSNWKTSNGMGRWRSEYIHYSVRFIAWCKGWEKNRERVEFRDWSISVISLYWILYFIYVQQVLFYNSSRVYEGTNDVLQVLMKNASLKKNTYSSTQ